VLCDEKDKSFACHICPQVYEPVNRAWESSLEIITRFGMGGAHVDEEKKEENQGLWEYFHFLSFAHLFNKC
jgi:hypothetical protein